MIDKTLSDHLNRIEGKVDKVHDHVTALLTTTAVQQTLIERNTQDLEDHMARTEALEELVEQEKQLRVEWQGYIKGMHKLIAGGVIILTLINLAQRVFL